MGRPSGCRAATEGVTVVMYADAVTEADVRRRVAREVHDRIGSGLALVLRRLDFLERAGAALDPAERARLDEVRAALLDTLGATRELVTALRGDGRPPGPDAAAAVVRAAAPRGPVPLEASLRGFLRAVAPFGAQVRVAVHGEDRWLPDGLRDELFVVLREALRNVLAHARARRASVTVVIAPHEVNAAVGDDGRGFDPSRVRSGANGLAAMRERAEALGGTATITSAPGRGTEVALWAPIKESSARD